ncbi:23S rRNA (uracil-C(5))-methyltransferase RlmCD [Compostibacillus humi]|uniref:23S rRNA (Uracil-C(5))-methyltransferase RlmCD n=1 Tax=Compostibacillus humi TaxID=1245525 RepID=A0A8J2TL27_9BACI|nr:23S rRNA (uracil(1939)-C(5))-methyltransferase RlmD [Compostibacillus humi]GFZ78890.1 23S rRNA (uracil-C(5))-methyltransferase RlmCD [Compostibacillus humi]
MTDKTTYDVKVHRLDEKGFGQAVYWQENEQGNPRKLKFTIPETLPEEEVKISIDRPGKRRMRGKVEKIINPHPERTEPLCPHFTRCGGCVWQHWQYEGQLKQKTEHVRQALISNGFDPSLVLDAIGMENPWHYRNKMEFTFAPDGSMGLHEQGNFRKIISLETCLIASKGMTEAALAVARWAKENKLPGYDKQNHEGLLRHLMVRESFATGEIMLALFATEPPTGKWKDAVQQLTEQIERDFPNVKSLLWMENTLWADRTQAEEVHVLSGRDFIYDELSGYRYRLWFDTFFQTNPQQAEVLVEEALKMGEPKKSEKMIDLFCGVGTFSLPFAARTKALAGVEIVETSIASAKRNAKENGIDNTYFLASDARRGIDVVLEEFGRPDLLMLDPPRSGAGGKVMRRIGRAQPSRIVYVSCNPVTFASDIKELVPFGYELKKVQPVDLFPHTVHVECVSQIVLK